MNYRLAWVIFGALCGLCASASVPTTGPVPTVPSTAAAAATPTTAAAAPATVTADVPDNSADADSVRMAIVGIVAFFFGLVIALVLHFLGILPEKKNKDATADSDDVKTVDGAAGSEPMDEVAAQLMD